MKSLLIPAALSAAFTIAITPALAATSLPAGTIKNVVLVHGAWADSSSWNNVTRILKSKGYHVTAVNIPLTSLDADAAATKAIVDAQDGPTVLVGHSWGGFVIGEAGNDPKVNALVYVSAFAPEKGESVATLSAGGPPSKGVQAIRPDDKGFLYLDKTALPRCSVKISRQANQQRWPTRNCRSITRRLTSRQRSPHGIRSHHGLSYPIRISSSIPARRSFSRLESRPRRRLSRAAMTA